MFAQGRKARSRKWVAFVAAYLLVLQAIVAGLASGAHAATMSFDRTLAMTLCAPGATADATSTDPAKSGHDSASCCMLGCSVSSVGAPAAATPYAPVIYRAGDFVAFAHHRDEPRGFVSQRSPANPRAPPVSA